MLHTRLKRPINGQFGGLAVAFAAVKKARIDAVLAERGLFPSRSAAAGAVRAGEVRVGKDGPVALRPSQLVEPEAALIVDSGPRYVSRGGIKLENALEALGIDVSGRDCLDVGASTGGFTDCLLQRGAARVAAVDVAYGQLDLRLREDPRVTVIERLNARAHGARRPALRADAARPSTSPSSRWPRCCRRSPAAWRPAARCWRWSSRSSSWAASGSAAASSATPATAARRSSRVAHAAGELGLPVRGFASSGLPGPEGQPRDLRLVRRRGRGARGPRGRDPRRRGGRPVKTAALITHSHPPAATEAVAVAVAVAREAGWRLVATARELAKHGAAAEGIEVVASDKPRPDICLVLGGDGSILHALRRFARTGVPVFGVNFGTVGFLAAVERGRSRGGASAARWPARSRRSSCRGSRSSSTAPAGIGLNDVTLTRRPHDRVAELSYRIAGEEVGHVRCDGLVAATPAGSTGYNLANQGPILAWGVKGYVVSYISPHSLTARALVVAPGDVLHVGNAAGREPVEVAIDGDLARRPRRRGRRWRSASSTSVGRLAQLPGTSFYQRIREKFGHLAV